MRVCKSFFDFVLIFIPPPPAAAAVVAAAVVATRCCRLHVCVCAYVCRGSFYNVNHIYIFYPYYVSPVVLSFSLMQSHTYEHTHTHASTRSIHHLHPLLNTTCLNLSTVSYDRFLVYHFWSFPAFIVVIFREKVSYIIWVQGVDLFSLVSTGGVTRHHFSQK